jgi:hypothetical protein
VSAEEFENYEYFDPKNAKKYKIADFDKIYKFEKYVIDDKISKSQNNKISSY